MKLIKRIKHWIDGIKLKLLKKRHNDQRLTYWQEKERKRQLRADIKANKEAEKHEKKEKKDLPKLSDMNRTGRRDYMSRVQKSMIKVRRWKPKQKYKRIPPLNMSPRARELERLQKLENKRGI